MRPRQNGKNPRERGFALMAALAIVVVLGATSAVMLRLTAAEQAGERIGILGARARWAARSGLEWALYEASEMGDCPAAQTTLNLSEGALSGFRVDVRCTSSRHFEGSEQHISLLIRSEARFGTLGTADFVYREMQVSIVL